MRRSAVAIALVAGCGSGSAQPADAPSDAAAVGPHPFGTHGAYVTDGVELPSNHTPSELDAATAAFYRRWKAAYLVAGCTPGTYRVKTSPATSAFTVSEGHGYGMLIAAIMAGEEPDARAIFDGLYAYYAEHPSGGNPALMSWAQNAVCADVDGNDSATDGDLDIAYALLLADRQWGSGGVIDYRAAALRMIAAVGASEVHPAGSILVGDWVAAGDPFYTGTRLSDLVPSHFKAYAAASGDVRWPTVVDRSYGIVVHLQAEFAAATGLVPDFAIDATGAAPQPAPADWLEGPDDGHYGYNACRVPWRLATDYLVTGDARARAAVRRLEAFVRTSTGGDPTAIRDGYRLDGVALGASPELPFVAPLLVGAMVAPDGGSNQPWLDALWDDVEGRPDTDYYGDTLKLLAMIVASGNWWMP